MEMTFCAKNVVFGSKKHVICLIPDMVTAYLLSSQEFSLKFSAKIALGSLT